LIRSAIDSIDFSPVKAADSEAKVRDTIRILIWRWIEENAEERVTLRIWIFRKDFRIKELYEVFAIVLGPRPIFVP
jgi:hypothetical protein